MEESLIITAFEELYPDKEFTYVPVIKYSGKFRGFNANIYYSPRKIEVRMGKQWRKVSSEIKIGMIQSLLVKIFRPKTMKKVKTTNMDLYNMFLKNVHVALPKIVETPFLQEKFHILNQQFFDGLLEQPSIKWGSFSTNRLGSYDYGTDTIVLTRYLDGAPEEYLEYVMYHEMLHKKHKFTHTNGRSLHHSKAFKQDEAKYPRAALLEKEIPRFIASKRRRKPAKVVQSFLRKFW